MSETDINLESVRAELARLDAEIAEKRTKYPNLNEAKQRALLAAKSAVLSDARAAEFVAALTAEQAPDPTPESDTTPDPSDPGPQPLPHALDAAPVNSKIVVVSGQGAVLATPAGVQPLPASDTANRLARGTKIRKTASETFLVTAFNKDGEEFTREYRGAAGEVLASLAALQV